MTSLAPQRGQHQGPAADSYPASTDHALTQVFESLPDGILLLDRNWRITYANPRARQISRLGDDDLHSKTHWELYPETVGTIVQETYERVMETREEGHLQAVFYAPFQVWLNVRVLPVEDGIALYYRDVTEQKQHESALIQSEKLAAVGRMASSIAHEINNRWSRSPTCSTSRAPTPCCPRSRTCSTSPTRSCAGSPSSPTRRSASTSRPAARAKSAALRYSPRSSASLKAGSRTPPSRSKNANAPRARSPA